MLTLFCKDVDICFSKNVRKLRGAKAHLVTYKHVSTGFLENCQSNSIFLLVKLNCVCKRKSVLEVSMLMCAASKTQMIPA